MKMNMNMKKIVLILLLIYMMSVMKFGGDHPHRTPARGNHKKINGNIKKNVVSLSTIPPRISKIEPLLENLQNQEIIDVIYLNIPWYCKKLKMKYKIPSFIKKYNKVYINRCEDYGPATKLLPVLEKEVNPNTNIIICDDDNIYKSTWASKLIDHSNKNLNKVISYSSWNTQTQYNGTLNFTVFSAFKGVIFKRHFFKNFKKFFLNLDKTCYWGDDLGISYYLYLQKIPIITIELDNNSYINKDSYGQLQYSLREGKKYTNGNNYNYITCLKKLR